VDEKTFNEPRLALNRIYTRMGDDGNTSLVGGQRVPKDDVRIEAYGTVDEVNALIGTARVSLAELRREHPRLAELDLILLRVQNELFNLGSILATLPQDVHPKQARITEADVRQLEVEMDRMNADLPALRSFILPGGSRLSTELHVCRTVCRRAERILAGMSRREQVPEDALQYLNRLSDAAFVWSRWVNHALGIQEELWQPNQSSSALKRAASIEDGSAST
jgi:cob(I)alamin adenosyltransferase